jgi:hypothetical protein
MTDDHDPTATATAMREQINGMEVLRARRLLERAGYRVDKASTPEEQEAAWVQLHGEPEGFILYLFDPWRTPIPLDTLAHGLAHEPRFAGHTRTNHPVAVHCYRGSYLLGDPNDAIDFLFHDASEGLGMRDLMGKVKALPEMAFYREREADVMSAVAGTFRLRDRFWEREAIKAADRVMLHREQCELVSRPPDGFEWGFWKTDLPAGGTTGWTWKRIDEPVYAEQAKALWLVRLAELGDIAGRTDLADMARAVLEADLRRRLERAGALPWNLGDLVGL